MTQPSDDLERQFRAALPDTDDQDCPPADEYWAAAAGELAFQQLRALVDHGATCARCAEAWRILVDVRRAAGDDPAEVNDPPSPRPLLGEAPGRFPVQTRALLPLALSAMAAVGLWVVLRPPPVRPPPVERGAGNVASVRAESPELQPARNAVLRWSEVPGASSYNVTVLTPDLVVVHQAVGLSAREFRLPEAVGQRAAGTGLLWNVDAVMPDGRTVASPTFELRLGAGP
jgi:bacterioferritin-associated ferredoxin